MYTRTLVICSPCSSSSWLANTYRQCWTKHRFTLECSATLATAETLQ